MVRGQPFLIKAFRREKVKVAGEIDAVDATTKDKSWESHLVFTLRAFGN